MNRIIISGAKGFVGRNLIDILKRDKKKYSLFSLDITNGFDLTDFNLLKDIDSFDVFVHLANLSFVPDSYIKPLDFYRTNYLTTLNALELCRRKNARMIYISSYIYGNPIHQPVDESHPIYPFNPYAQTKVICEKLCEGYYRDFGVSSIILRPFNIYGVGQKGKLLIPEIVEQLKCGNHVRLKDPYPRRDYVNVKDVAFAIKKCIDTPLESCEAFNICSGKSYSVKEITDIFNLLLQDKAIFSFGISDRKNEVNETVGCYSKFNRATGWTPTISLEDGIKNIIEFEGL